MTMKAIMMMTTKMIKATVMETNCRGFTMSRATTTMAQRRGGSQYKLLLSFLKFDTCFFSFFSVDYFSNFDFPYEPKLIWYQTEKIREYKK